MWRFCYATYNLATNEPQLGAKWATTAVNGGCIALAGVNGFQPHWRKARKGALSLIDIAQSSLSRLSYLSLKR
ncbi:hypothetical protein BJK05_02330 [Pectobacterium polaris]|nr:hypothetical protein BJK05_02330 [Pectobacterium polaris]